MHRLRVFSKRPFGRWPSSVAFCYSRTAAADPPWAYMLQPRAAAAAASTSAAKQEKKIPKPQKLLCQDDTVQRTGTSNSWPAGLAILTQHLCSGLSRHCKRLLSQTPNLSDRLKGVSGLVELTPSGKAFRLKLLEFAMARLAVLLPKIQAAYQKRRAYSKTHRFFWHHPMMAAAMPSGSLYETGLYSLTPLAQSTPRVGATDSSVSLSLRAFDLNILSAVPSAAYGIHTGSILPAAAAGHNHQSHSEQPPSRLLTRKWVLSTAAKSSKDLCTAAAAASGR